MDDNFEEIISTKSVTFCRKYNQAITKLTEQVKKNPENFEKYFRDFSDEYFMIRPLWIIWKHRIYHHHMQINSLKEPIQKDLAFIRDKGRSHFFYDQEFYFLEDSEFLKLYDFIRPRGHLDCECPGYHGTLMKKYKWAEAELSFPHSNLKEQMYLFDDASSVPVSRELIKTCKKNMILYEKIKVVENYDNKWFNAILNVKDEEFITQNIEHRIAKNICNKNLWKLYLDYLRNKNRIKMLEVYSNYIRFFLDDFEMIEKYRQETTRLRSPKISIFWKNPLDYENPLPELKQFIYKTDPYVPDNNYILPMPSFENPLPQAFPFRQPLMNYIFKNANPQILHKLFKTCKFIYSLFKTPICHHLVLGTQDCEKSGFLDFDRQAMQIALNSLDTLPPLNLHISNSLYATLHSKDNFEYFMPFIAKCDLKFLTLYYQKLTMESFDFLTKSGKIEELFLMDTKIIKDDNCLASIEEILEKTPNIKIFYSDLCKTTEKTTQILAELSFNNKFETFAVYEIDENFEPHSFCKFAEKNFAIGADVRISQHATVINDDTFKTIVKEYFGEKMFFKFVFEDD